MCFNAPFRLYLFIRPINKGLIVSTPEFSVFLEFYFLFFSRGGDDSSL